MAPLPVENTKRYFLDYTVASKNHTCECRTATLATDADASTAFDDLFGALSPQLFAVTVQGMRVAALGSTVTLPAVYSGSTSFGSGAGTAADSGGYAAWVGRDVLGIRVRVTVFGSKITATGGNWRAEPGENSDLDAALAVLVGTTNTFFTIGLLKPIWNNYTNNGYNAYWRNHTR